MFILITGVMVNVPLIWLFLKERKSLCASKVLGLNLVVMDLIYLSIMPVNLIYETNWDQRVRNNHSVFSSTLQNLNTTHPMEMARDTFSMFNLIGCPLLLTCMCFERYLAVTRPVLYLRVRKWEYRMAVSAAVWAITLTFCVATVLVDDMTVIMVCVSTIISCTFIIMLMCLGAVVWSLWQQSPAHTTHGIDQRSPLKRRAVANVLVVVIPAVISYLPVLVLLPVYYLHESLNRAMCNAFQLSSLFPVFGVLIGPLFYFSKARQMCCLSGTGKTFNK
ncbi:uracil nucleotide/cysteinyl leukotriene receptor-like [Seriola dumerili]|uniref:uracil nucleotide/cysteinyl leukotriene receptor-like n=1 Tax=Seriola dumerili TaxID=41447 RepID=UPI000BBE95EB|nr:uracil nucleotide/cysteinyl leukotriene receptor-like [Seriola dumerili]